MRALGPRGQGKNSGVNSSFLPLSLGHWSHRPSPRGDSDPAVVPARSASPVSSPLLQRMRSRLRPPGSPSPGGAPLPRPPPPDAGDPGHLATVGSPGPELRTAEDSPLGSRSQPDTPWIPGPGRCRARPHPPRSAPSALPTWSNASRSTRGDWSEPTTQIENKISVIRRGLSGLAARIS